MEVKTIDDILKLQDEFVQKVQKQMEMVSKGKAPSADLLLKEKKELLLHYKERLEAATASREEAVHRYDEDIRHHNEQITRLEKEIKAEKKAIKQSTQAATKAKGQGKTKP